MSLIINNHKKLHVNILNKKNIFIRNMFSQMMNALKGKTYSPINQIRPSSSSTLDHFEQQKLASQLKKIIKSSNEYKIEISEMHVTLRLEEIFEEQLKQEPPQNCTISIYKRNQINTVYTDITLKQEEEEICSTFISKIKNELKSQNLIFENKLELSVTSY